MKNDITFIENGKIQFKSCAEIRKIRGEHKDYETIDIGAKELALLIIIFICTLPLIPVAYKLLETMTQH